MTAALIETPQPADVLGDCDHRTCSGYRSPDAEQHSTDCRGSHPCGWRSRVPEFLLPEMDRIRRGEPRLSPLYRELAIEIATVARYGQETA